MLVMREATERDDLDALNEGNGAWMGASLIRTVRAAGGDELPGTMLVPEVDGVPAGLAFGVVRPSPSGGLGIAAVYVLPAFRRQGIGSALWQAVRDVCSPVHVQRILTMAAADDLLTREVAVAHGFTAGGVHLESELDLPTFQSPDRTPQLGDLVIRPLPDDPDEATWAALFTLWRRLFMDTPDAQTGAAPPAEVLRKVLSQPWQSMVLWDGAEMVGLTTAAVRDQAARRLNVMLIGIDPAYRGRGLSTALQAAHCVVLRDAGWQVLVTQNMDGNAAILASNDALGFRRVSATVELTYDYPRP